MTEVWEVKEIEADPGVFYYFVIVSGVDPEICVCDCPNKERAEEIVRIKNGMSQEFEDVLMRNQELMTQLHTVCKEVEENHCLWCDCVDNGDLIGRNCLVCDLVAIWNPKFVEDFRAKFDPEF